MLRSTTSAPTPSERTIVKDELFAARTDNRLAKKKTETTLSGRKP